MRKKEPFDKPKSLKSELEKTIKFEPRWHLLEPSLELMLKSARECKGVQKREKCNGPFS